jgi:pimeloyl-ACP methyl ester carboxylesterase
VAHGAPSSAAGFTIDDVAHEIIEGINTRVDGKLVVVGHSLGGYVTLAMAAQHPELLAGISLLHSTAYADTDEKKLSRTKVIEFIQQNGVEAFTSNFISPLFADRRDPAIAGVRRINMESQQQTVIGYTQAMRDRYERTDVLKSFASPIMFLAGNLDPGIPLKSIEEQATLSDGIEVKILKGQAHMAMIEDADRTALFLREFLKRCFRIIK